MIPLGSFQLSTQDSMIPLNGVVLKIHTCVSLEK